MTDYPDTLQADLAHHEREQEAADDRYQRELAAHPLEMYEVTAWEHAFDEPGYELLLRLSEDMPVSVLYALCVFAEVPMRFNIDHIGREAAQRAIRRGIESWLRDEQERLQRECIEGIFP